MKHLIHQMIRLKSLPQKIALSLYWTKLPSSFSFLWLALIMPISALSSFSGCVTVNVNFPESAVQKATDDYVKDLYRTKEKGKASSGSSLIKRNSEILTPILFVLNWILPSAQAVESEDFQFRTSTEKTKEIQARQATRLQELEEKAAGQWGENNLGFVEAKFSVEFKKKELLTKKIESLIKSENEDRKALYQEVLDTNKLPPARLIDIQKKFANSFREVLPAGNWKQEDSGDWKKK